MAIQRISLKDAQVYFSPRGPLAAQLKGGALKGLLSAALRAKRDLVAREIPALGGQKPVDRGIYRAGWQVQKTPRGAVLYNPVPHASFIEFGVPASNVVASYKAHVALAEWVQRKLGGKRKGVKVEAARAQTASVNAAKEKYDQAKKTWTLRSKKAMAKGKPSPPQPKAPSILTSKGRMKHDFGYAWQVAGAILGAMKKRGIFGRGQGLRILEKYARAALPSVVREEVEREMKRAVEG